MIDGLASERVLSNVYLLFLHLILLDRNFLSDSILFLRFVSLSGDVFSIIVIVDHNSDRILVLSGQHQLFCL